MFDQQRPFNRTDRVSDKVRHSISEVILKNPILSKGLITITKVTMSKDLRYAKVFFSHIDTDLENSDLEKKLNQNKSKIKYLMGLNLGAQYVPKINFYFDEKYAKSARIENLLNKVRNNK